MWEILRATDITGLGDRNIPLMFREVVERGWSVTAADGRVLTDLVPETPGTYGDRLAEETTINGRGMTDYETSRPHRTNVRPSSSGGVWRMRAPTFGRRRRSSVTLR
ncbi:hypothetical protein ACIODW_06510 [Streptomyces sp. NPDC087897]|uniref:hypothetical protein n=1 Tax=Streptomyces sp. NPDC087897 TaxID=3365817 RepID=UPI00381C207B